MLQKYEMKFQVLLLVCLWLYAARRFYTVWSTVLNFSPIANRDNGEQPKGEKHSGRESLWSLPQWIVVIQSPKKWLVRGLVKFLLAVP